MKTILFFLDGLEVLTRWLCMGLMIMLPAIVFVKVLFRYVFNNPIIWSDEVIMLMLLALTYLGAAIASYKKKHIYVELLETAVSKYCPRRLKAIQTGVTLVTMTVLGGITYYGFRIMSFSSDQETDILMMSYAWVYAITTMGLIFIVLLTLKGLIEELTACEG